MGRCDRDHPDPGAVEEAPAERLLAACLRHDEAGESRAIEELLAANPEHAQRVLELLAVLRRYGLIRRRGTP